MIFGGFSAFISHFLNHLINRLNDHADEDLSEEESNDHEESTSDGKSWISSSGRSLALSEIGEGQSALVIPGKQGQLCVLKDKENNKRWEKAWHAVNEMVQSEERYVQKLALLEKVLRGNLVCFIKKKF